jgi:Asp-tRNA(Asn)/Glu-tRNA(Gln) amidotransferase A subunit family amidase
MNDHSRGGQMLSALDLVRRVEAGELKPRDAVELCAEAIAARENEVGAFAALDLDAARRAAAAPDLASMPLRGLPVAFKDIFDTADLPTQYGSPIYAGYRPPADASAVALTRRAGGVVLAIRTTSRIPRAAPRPVPPLR